MKNFYSAIFAAVFAAIQFSPALADTTYVAGNVSGVWDIAGSPYIANDSIYVPEGQSLTIEPGVSVSLNTFLNSAFYIYGTLIAEGSLEDSIYFNLGDFIIIDSESQSLLRYCVLTGSLAKVKFINGDIVFDSNTIASSDYGTWDRDQIILCDAEDATISHNDISFQVNTTVYGPMYAIYGNGSATVLNNMIDVDGYVWDTFWSAREVFGIKGITGLIINNDINVHSNGGMNSYARTVGIADFNGNIIGNNIYTSQEGNIVPPAVFCLEECSGIIKGNLFYSFRSSTEDIAGCIKDCSGLIENNTFDLACNYGYGIYECSGEIENNIIYRSGGIFCTGIYGESNNSYNCYWGFSHIYAGGASQGIGEINENPLFSTNYQLQPFSPCIDAGNPEDPIDPDSTIGDMGFSYYPQSEKSPLIIHAVPDTINLGDPGVFFMEYIGNPQPEFEILYSPDWLTFYAEPPLFNWPANIPSGIDSLIIHSTNSLGDTTQTFHFVVPGDLPPVIVEYWPESLDTVSMFQQVDFGVNAFDPEGFDLQYSWYYNDSFVSGDSIALVTFVEYGLSQVKVIINDNEHQDSILWNDIYVSTGNNIFVPQDYSTIQEAIDNCEIYGDTIFVSPGIYQENIDYSGKNAAIISIEGPENTVIDGSAAGPVVSFQSGEDSLASIIGFTIQNGHNNYGGGIYSRYSSPKIMDNIIVNNTATNRGGGIYISDGSATIVGNIIEQNTSVVYGAGIYSYNCTSVIVDNVIQANLLDETGFPLPVYAAGAGCMLYQSYAQISGNYISFNQIISSESNDGNGAGVYLNSNSIGSDTYYLINNVLEGNTINSTGNIAGVGIHAENSVVSNNLIINNTGIGSTFCNGIGIYAHESELTNNTFYGNTSENGGVDLYLETSTNSRNNIVSNSINAYGVFADASSQISYSDYFNNELGDYYDTNPGVGDIYGNPLFVDPVNGDFNLQWGSPCIDAGDPNSPLDPDSTIADMGAYYFDQSVSITKEENLPVIPIEFSFQNPYPNPFNPETTIRFGLPENSKIKIFVHDILGREIAVLVDKYFQSGYHSLRWNAADNPSGIYFITFQSPKYSQVRKIILLK